MTKKTTMKRSNSSPPTDDQNENNERRRMQMIIDMALEKYRKSKLQKQTKDNGTQDEDNKISSNEQTSNDNRGLDKFRQSTLHRQLIPDRHDGDRKWASVEPNYTNIALEYCRPSALQSQIEYGHKRIAAVEPTYKKQDLSPDVVYRAVNSNQNSFPYKLYDMLQDSDSKEAIAWTENGDAFRILDHQLLSNVLPKYFRHNNVNSFIRQVYFWDFRKLGYGPESGCYKNEVNQNGSNCMFCFSQRLLFS